MKLTTSRIFEAMDFDEERIGAKSHGFNTPDLLRKEIGSMAADKLSILMLDRAIVKTSSRTPGSLRRLTLCPQLPSSTGLT